MILIFLILQSNFVTDAAFCSAYCDTCSGWLSNQCSSCDLTLFYQNSTQCIVN